VLPSAAWCLCSAPRAPRLGPFGQPLFGRRVLRDGPLDRADRRAANVIPIMRQIQRNGATSLRQIAEALNARGISAPRGGQWHATSVRNVMARALA